MYRAEIQGDAEGKAITVPRKAVQAGGRNRVRFDIEGRGRFGYAVTLTGFARDFGPEQDRRNRTLLVNRRVYLAAEPTFEGKTLPTGFGVAVGAQHFENNVTQVAFGGRARVRIDAIRIERPGLPAWEREFVLVEEHLPAGTTLVEGSVHSNASHHTLVDGVLTFYFVPDQWPSGIEYEVFGYLPGQYRALPVEIRSAYDPTRRHLGKTDELQVLPPGEESTDPYKPTPDERYARGQALFDAGRLAEAAETLEPLWNDYTLREDVAKETARMLLMAFIENYTPRKVVQFFEVLKERSPELVIPFDKILVIGRAYRDIGEFERAYLVWRGLVEASYLEDAHLGEVLRQRGQVLESVAFLLDLWRSYPNTASIESDFFGIGQYLASLASEAVNNPSLRRQLNEIDASRSTLLLQSSRLIQVFLSQSPKNPLADEASLALVGNDLELEDYETVVTLSERFARLYPKSKFLDSFQYSEALGRFHLGQYDRAIEVAEAIVKATYKDDNGVEQPSPNKWQAIYILGQIYDARRQADKAVDYYRRVADRFTDAAEAVASLTKKELDLPEVSITRLREAPKVADNAAQSPLPQRRYRSSRGGEAAAAPAGRGDLVSQYPRGGREGLSRGPDASVPHPAQPRRHRRDRPGGHHPLARKEDPAGGRGDLRRQGAGTRPPARQGGSLPGHGPWR